MNEIGCRDSAFGEIEVIPEMTIYAPNAFSPNGDGRNDKFSLLGTYLTGYYLAIFDRWGERIFETQEYENEWNGTDQNKGTPAPVGVYYWIATASDYQGHKQNFSGTVTLIR